MSIVVAEKTARTTGWPAWPTSRQCKWIDGDPKREGEWHWCLEPVGEPGQQYCPDHLERVYNVDRR